ncbi:MAG: molybdopterin molybdotransferase MoeA [Solirubrobacteraceae bacterium]|nr:molybdopterin molybdotransferase MoeA [Solirubrobacteraceae bacterium]
MTRLLSIAQARELVRAAVVPLEDEPVPVEAALGRVLAEDVAAAHDVAPFDSSAMDGFALRAERPRTPAGTTLPIVGESRAGRPAERPVGPGEAVRISTGAMLPEGADAVLQIELADEAGGRVTLRDDVAPGRNVRRAGEDLRAGDVVLRAGTILGPAELGVAVGAGRAEVRCARPPRVAVVATGDELADPGEPLRPGQIHNTNATTLAALAMQHGARVFTVTGAPDTQEGTEEALAAALEEADLVLVSGGVSVGPHDHVKPALEALGVEQRFWRVALRPGKPTWFGVRDGVLVFGLPGNPVSSMVTFLLFARPALRALQHAPFDVERRAAVLTEPVERQPERDEAVRVALATGPDGTLRATPTGPQGSHVLSSMVGAAGLAIVEAGDGDLPAGAVVPVEPI